MELKTELDLPRSDRTAPPPFRRRVLEMIQGYWVSQICGAVARLGLPDHLLDGPRDVLELAGLTASDPDGLGRLLRAAATVGLFTELENERFELTTLGAQLATSDAVGSLGDLAIALTAPGHWLPYGRLLEAVVTGQPQARQALGTDPWSYYGSHPEERWHFARAMGAISMQAAEAVARHYDASRFRRIVDVGGSQGVLLTGLLQAAPAASGVLFDLPEVIDGARERLATSDLADRVELVGGDFFEHVPAGGDLYLLKSILHDWDDERALRILRNVQHAAAPGARLAVIEVLLPHEPGPSRAHLGNLLMLVELGGRERTLDHYADLLDRAGFELQQTIPVPIPAWPFTVVEAVRR